MVRAPPGHASGHLELIQGAGKKWSKASGYGFGGLKGSKAVIDNRQTMSAIAMQSNLLPAS